MQYIFISIIILLIISNLILFYLFKKKINKIIDREIIKRKNDIDKEVNNEKETIINNLNNEFKEKKNQLNNEILVLNKEIEIKKSFIQNQKRDIDEELINYRKQQLAIIDSQIYEQRLEYEKELDKELFSLKEEKRQSIVDLDNQLLQLRATIEDYRKKQETINKAILAKKELKEKETFFKINLTQDEIDDILYIKDFEKRFSNKELLSKAVYECYYKKPLMELEKRVLQNEEFSGIYKITSTLTDEIYIGRAVNIKKRWTDHIKSSLGIGSLVSSTLHKRMAQDGVWNFTFEVLEKVDKDKINEREAYWIDFYKSNQYGLNIKAGDKSGIKQ